jgi:hypothetical protein
MAAQLAVLGLLFGARRGEEVGISRSGLLLAGAEPQDGRCNVGAGKPFDIGCKTFRRRHLPGRIGDKGGCKEAGC